MSLILSVLPDILAVCRLHADAEIPTWAFRESLFALVRTEDELSIVCPESNVPDVIQSERGWRALKVQGPLDFSLVGILADLATVLADVGVSIFAISTYETDYILIKENQLSIAVNALRQAEYSVSNP
jgi:hypothetical protein